MRVKGTAKAVTHQVPNGL